MSANTPQIEKIPGNRRRYAVGVDFLGAFYLIKFQAQAYCSLKFFFNLIYIFWFLLVDYLMHVSWIFMVCYMLSRRKLIILNSHLSETANSYHIKLLFIGWNDNLFPLFFVIIFNRMSANTPQNEMNAGNRRWYVVNVDF